MTIYSDYSLVPDEIFLNIFSHLEWKTLLTCRRVCIRWYNLSGDTQLPQHEKIKERLQNLSLLPAHTPSAPAWNMLKLCWKATCEVYVDISLSMRSADDKKRKLPVDTQALSRARTVLEKIRGFVQEVQVFTFADSCQKVCTLNSKASLDSVIQCIGHESEGETRLDFLVNRLSFYEREKPREKDKKLTLLFILSDLDYNTLMSGTLCEQIKKTVVVVNNLRNFNLCFVDILHKKKFYAEFKTTFKNYLGTSEVPCVQIVQERSDMQPEKKARIE